MPSSVIESLDAGGTDMKIKTSELIGPALDWAVAKCLGLGKLHYIDVVGRISTLKTAVMVWSMELPGDGHGDKFSPSTNWSQGGPIIEQEKIETYWHTQLEIWAARCNGNLRYGPTPLIAAMRCYVTSKLGDEVNVPDWEQATPPAQPRETSND